MVTLFPSLLAFTFNLLADCNTVISSLVLILILRVKDFSFNSILEFHIKSILKSLPCQIIFRPKNLLVRNGSLFLKVKNKIKTIKQKKKGE